MADPDPVPAKQERPCPACGAPLEDVHCKVRCTRCAYFEDCSDGMLPEYGVEQEHTHPAILHVPRVIQPFPGCS